MQLTLDERGRLDFVPTLRRRWADTVCLHRALVDTEVIGMDLAAPCLRLRRARAGAAGLAIRCVHP